MCMSREKIMAMGDRLRRTRLALNMTQAELGKILGIPGTTQVSKYVRRRKRGQSHVEAIVGVRTEGTGAKKEPSW